MNPKTKIKVAIDLAMTALFLILLNLAWTGLRVHEILGLGVTAIFTAHLFVNRQWIAAVARRWRDKQSRKTRFLFILDALLGPSMLLTVISGLLISQELFPGLTDSSFNAWFVVHQITSWVSLGVVVLHTVIHWQWIAHVIRQLNQTRAANPEVRQSLSGRLSVFAARALIGFFALVTVYSVANGKWLDLLLPAAADSGTDGTADTQVNTGSTTASTVIVAADETGTTTVTIQPSTTTTTESAMTLQQYLSRLTCTACHKHCLLSSPRCARGRRQAETATTEYNEKLEAGTL